MSKPLVHELSPAKRRRLLILGLARALATTTLVVTFYYVLPLNKIGGNGVATALLGGLLVLATVVFYQVRAILKANYPVVRAVQSLATTAPLFLVLFAASYFLLSHSTAGTFNVGALTRTDALYFTTTVFATVGFGDIAPLSQFARGLVTVQMVLDLLILGFGVRVFVSAVQVARSQGPRRGVQAGSDLVDEIDPEM